MARVPYLQQSDLPPEHRELLARPIALNRAMANNPEASRAMSGLAMYIRHKSRVDPRLRELAILQVGWLARSPYEWSHHVKIGYDFGVTDADIEALKAETDGRDSGLPTLDRNVLRAAREMTTEGKMRDETFAALHSELGHELIVELTIVIAFYNAVVRLLGTLAIDVEPEYQPYLDRYPLPR